MLLLSDQGQRDAGVSSRSRSVEGGPGMRGRS